MIHINPNKIKPDADWIERATKFTQELRLEVAELRADFIKAKRFDTWGAPILVDALRKVAGNKCWYSEVPLEGADPNVDHFRPKGTVSDWRCYDEA